jgi:hypothetical protein
MTHLAHDPSFLAIEDALDLVGQKYRVQRLVAGVIHFLAAGVVLTVAATLAAHAIGQGHITQAIAVVWGLGLLAMAAHWIARPLLFRPRALEMARLVESRVAGLCNGLTNSLLLADADDLADSPFLPSIFREIAALMEVHPVSAAIRWSDLRSRAIWLGAVALPFAVAAILMPGKIAHGWQQMFQPGAFVPAVGSMHILSVDPGDTSRVSGQPLEIAIDASGVSPAPQAKLIFDSGIDSQTLAPVLQPDGQTVRYGYRIEHVDRAFKYRVEVGDTQSTWYSVTLLQQIRLTGLTLKVTPPTYTNKPTQTLTLDPANPASTPISVPQGSSVHVTATLDVPVKGAMLAAGDAPPVAMTSLGDAGAFSGDVVVLDETLLQILPTEGGQVLAKLPESALAVHCQKDLPPVVRMNWPREDVSIGPDVPLRITASLGDDWGVTQYRVLTATAADQPMTAAITTNVPADKTAQTVDSTLRIPAAQRTAGSTLFVQVEATDNRNLMSVMKDGGPQTSLGPKIQIRFVDPAAIAKQATDQADRLRDRLLQMLQNQIGLNEQTVAWKAGDKPGMVKIGSGQTDLRQLMVDTAAAPLFSDDTRAVQKTLQLMAANPAQEAIDISAATAVEPVAAQAQVLGGTLQARQRTIMSTLRSLLGTVATAREAATQPTTRTSDPLLSQADALRDLDKALQEFMKEQQRILDQQASLAKKPVDDFDQQDKDNLDALKKDEQNLDAFMQQQVVDYSKNGTQDMSNPDMLRDLMQTYDEVTLAANALKTPANETAVPLEESGLELAKKLDSNIEKWLSNVPDHTAWSMEDPVTKTEAPMQELPQNLQDLVGDLLEQQEDLLQDAQDANSNWHDSMNKGNGWDALDGPISDNSAAGITGNNLPNNNTMQGRSGEGRTGQSEGEFVGDSAVGKGGRNTPTRLDPTPFQQGVVNDTSKDPTGGATGGGKLSGQGAAGLEGPTPPQQKQEMQRLADKEAQLRNQAERLNLDYQLDKYDSFRMLDSIALMRRLESDFQANRYDNVMQRKDILLNDLETSRLLLGGQTSVQQDTTPSGNLKLQQDISDSMKGNLPPAWSDALKQYYQKLSSQ